MSDRTLEEEIRAVVEEFVEEFVIPQMDERGKRIVEQALEEIVMPRLTALDTIPDQVRTNALAIAQHDDLISTLRRDHKIMLEEVRSMPDLIAGTVKATLEQAAIERNAERYEQLQQVAWKLVGAVVGSSAVMALVIRYIFGG